MTRSTTGRQVGTNTDKRDGAIGEAWETCQLVGEKELACTDGSGKGLGEYPSGRIWDMDITMTKGAKE